MVNYRQRLQKVLAFIEANTDTALDIEALSKLAHLSKYHFHRQFSLCFGISPFALVRSLKLKKAAYQLAFRTQLTVTDIAFEAGFENAESFSRAFRQLSGQSPSSFRKAPDWDYWQQQHKVLSDLAGVTMTEPLAYQVQRIDFPGISVAVFEHKGAPDQLMHSIRRFINWRKSQKLTPAVSRTFNLVYEDPATVPAADYRFDLCCEFDGDLADNSEAIVLKKIPAGPCAMIRHTGSDEQLAQVVRYLYSVWLEETQAELRDFPLFFERVRFFPDVPQHQAVTDLYLPIK
ncbi:AraC family transcriptional regulator [Rheinheimera mangrovi]|uniref:AraC family transcriptional regulator n=1 Tax=Rheinheimera mangrovi TaxID=2498451 RepID=UPI000F8D5E9E|nr:AraC family transcriptional regulator [Rheinheimera mangrovi]